MAHHPPHVDDYGVDPHDAPHHLVDAVDAGIGRRLVLEQTADGAHLRYTLAFETDVSVLLACFDSQPGLSLDQAGIPPVEVLWIAERIAASFGSVTAAN